MHFVHLELDAAPVGERHDCDTRGGSTSCGSNA
jgi:hypothetical protein